MKELSVTELKQMQDKGEAFTLIDVREPYEAEICHINGTLIPMGEVLDRLSEIPKEGKVVMHCRSGGRSGTVIQVLEEEHGYTNLYNLSGGILAWSAQIDPSLPSY
jgi:adenylyltransferase/sulfurtransferase